METSSEQKQTIRTLDARYQAIADSLLQGHRSFDELKSLVQSENAATQERVSDLLRIHQNMLSEKERSQRLLDSLHFPDIHCRQEQIADAHSETFQWIFDASPIAIRPWANFVEWLENGEGTYWINGKLGSGKSTLMSYICQDARTTTALAKWGGIGVIAPMFFFWNPGSHLQKSTEGLLRSLIYQILRERPDLAPLADSEGPLETWTDRRLHTSFRRITQDYSLRRSKLCLFIDGLDEFAGDQSSLIDLLRSITDGQHVKICLSSRPYIIFEDAFSSSCALKLQDLTRSDIERYTLDKIHSLPKIQLLSLRDGEIISKIAREIVARANGVFLWVSLAVKDQIEGLRNDDDIEMLWERLRTLPTEIEDIYVHLLSRISKIYKSETAQIIYIVLQSTVTQNMVTSSELRQCSVLDVALSFHKGLDHIISSSSADVPMTDILQECRRTEKRLFTTCSAFLETKDFPWDSRPVETFHFSEQQRELFRSGNATIDFLHRSAADFFQKDGQGREWLKESLVTEHQTSISDFLKTQVAKIRLVGFPRSNEGSLDDFPWFPKRPDDILDLLCNAEAELGHPPTSLCSAIDRAMTILHQQFQQDNQTDHWVLLASKGSSAELREMWVGSKTFSKEPETAVILSSSSENSEDSAQSSSPISSGVPQDFLGLMARLGLDLYVEERIKTSPSPLSVTYVNHLLSCALSSIHVGWRRKTNVECEKSLLRLIGFLLYQGANPNQIAVEGTLWTSFLLHLCIERSLTREFRTDGFQDAAWAAAAKAFLAAGASMDEQTSFPDFISEQAGDPSNSVSYFEETEGEVQKRIGYLDLARFHVRLSVLSCLSYCLPKAPQLTGLQEECISKGARYLVEFPSIKFPLFPRDSNVGRRSLPYVLSKEQSDRLVPAYEAYVLSDGPSYPNIWAERVALRQQLVALYHEFFEQEERRRFPKTCEETCLNN